MRPTEEEGKSVMEWTTGLDMLLIRDGPTCSRDDKDVESKDPFVV